MSLVSYKRCKFVRLITVSKLKKVSDIEQICQMPFSHKSFADESVLCWYFLSSLDMYQSCFLTVSIINFSLFFFPSWIKERKIYCLIVTMKSTIKLIISFLNLFFYIFCLRVVLLYKRVREGSGGRKLGLESSRWLQYLSE